MLEKFVHYILFYANADWLIQRVVWAFPFCGALASILILEILVNGWRDSSLGILAGARKTHLWDLFGFFLFISGAGRILTNLFFFGLAGWASEIAFGSPVIHKLNMRIPLPLALLLAFLLKDFLIYWSHRLKHSNALFWQVHEFHHSSTQLTWFTSFRVHPLDFLFYFFLVVVPTQVVFGMEFQNIFWFSVITSFFGKFTHSRLDWSLGWIGRWIFVSPRAHHHHHKIDESSGRNFGDTFIFWDRMFGSYEEPTESIKNLKQGIPMNPYEEENPSRAFLRPVVRFYGLLLGLNRVRNPLR